MVLCPHCGELPPREVVWYNEAYRKPGFPLAPVCPVCKVCGAEVAAGQKQYNGRVLILNGTCGSGKTSVAVELMQKHGFHALCR